ncbi:MAG TPA: molybdenum cofactor biosynthesis protein MoaE [Candidatus Acidoferrales bacterium]|nr:molybdenum cofactor biosynthesis protein MoaE [Candidatus Acidoferrales bacterium]
MNVEIELTRKPIPGMVPTPPAGAHGAWLEFRGVVRGEENCEKISALEYEAYPEMAKREIRRLLEEISTRYPCLAAKIIHRIGIIPVGETAIYAGVASSHRAEAIRLLAEFMDRLKQDVPIWKRRAVPLEGITEQQRYDGRNAESVGNPPGSTSQATTLDDALAKISIHCAPLTAVVLSLDECYGHILRETVCAPTDFPDCDRSTRDGYAILGNDTSETFQIVDTLHAADWKPRQLKTSETVRVATGASMPCANLRVIMQEDVERNGDRIRVTKRDSDLNIRRRGDEIKAGAPLVHAGARLDAGHLALLASAGCVRPAVGPRLRVLHFTTGDEVVPASQSPKPGQIRDSNSILIHGLLESFPCDLVHGHLREDFELATAQIKNLEEEMERAGVLLISGGASVGEKDFTRPLLESLGFEIVFGKVAIRPGRPTMFGVNGRRVAFGLPGNPLAHFVCFHLFVGPALAGLSGGEAKQFLRGKLAEPLEDASNPRETLWPARLDFNGGEARLRPLGWSSSGDVTCLTQANALLRVPPNCESFEAGAELDFLPC